MFKKSESGNPDIAVDRFRQASVSKQHNNLQFQEHYEAVAFSLQSLDRFDQVLPILQSQKFLSQLRVLFRIRVNVCGMGKEREI